MKKKIQPIANAVNLSQLSMLAKQNPRYARMFTGLAKIDASIKKLVEDIICNRVNDSSVYFIKTELSEQCYNLYLFHAEQKVTVGVSWLLIDFLRKCEDKTIEYDVNQKITSLLRMFDSTNLHKNQINWLN